MTKEKELSLDAADIRKILLSCSNRRLKAFLLVLCSSGVRSDTEACSIRRRDIDFDTNPTSIKIRADYTKTKVGRIVYITDEATYYLNQWLNFKGRDEPNELIFGAYENNIPDTVEDTKRMATNHYVRLNNEFARLLINVRMDERKETGVPEKRRHKITFHSLRRFTYSTVEQQVNTGYAEYLLGHSSCVYHTEKPEKISSIYRTRCMSALTILNYEIIEEKGKSIESRLEQKEQEISFMNERERHRDEEILQLKHQLKLFQEAQQTNEEKITNMERENKESLNRLLSLLAKESIVGKPAIPQSQLDLLSSGKLDAIPLAVSNHEGEDVKLFIINKDLESIRNNSKKVKKLAKGTTSGKKTTARDSSSDMQ
jgi:hypothetical protein